MLILTKDDIVELLKISATALDRIRKDADKDFPRPFRVGGANRWSADEVIAWLENNRGAR